MKNFKLLGLVAFALLLSLNAGVFLDNNNWESGVEVAHAETAISANPIPVPIPAPVVAIPWRKVLTFPCWIGGAPPPIGNGYPGLVSTCVWTPYLSCTPAACS